MDIKLIFFLFAANFVVLSLVYLIGYLFYFIKVKKKLAKYELLFDSEKKQIKQQTKDLLQITETIFDQYEKTHARSEKILSKLEKYDSKLKRMFVPEVSTSSTVQRQKQVPQVEKVVIPVAEDSSRKESFVSKKHQVIYDMADKGIGIVDISRATGRTKGEIELVLSLRKVQKVSC